MPPHNAPLHNNLMAIYNYTKIPSPGDEGNVLAQPSRALAFKVSNITLEMLNTLYIISIIRFYFSWFVECLFEINYDYYYDLRLSFRF